MEFQKVEVLVQCMINSDSDYRISRLSILGLKKIDFEKKKLVFFVIKFRKSGKRYYYIAILRLTSKFRNNLANCFL